MKIIRTAPSRRLLSGARAVFLLAWTLLVLAVLHFIWHLPAGGVEVVNSSGSGSIGQAAWWPLFHANFHAIYPILLLAPYLVFVSRRWTFGLTRWWLALVVHLLCAAAMLPGARLIERRISESLPTLVYVNSVTTIIGQKIDRVPALTKAIEIPIDLTAGLAAGTSRKIGISIGKGAPEAVKVADAAPRTAWADLFRWTKDDQKGLLIPAVGFLVISGLAHATAYYRRFRLREHQAVQLESQLAKSRLAVLQSQLQPHFLFNTLNGIVTLIRHRPAVAEEMMITLSSLLRTGLDSSRRSLIPVSREITFLERYLALQRMRFEDRLQVTWDIHPDTRDVPIPALLLQPLVENAIIHGIEPSPDPGCLDISTRLQDGELVITVADNGVGFELGGPPRGTGQGTANVRELLELFYPQQHRFDISSQPGQGTRITLRIPVRPAVEAP